MWATLEVVIVRTFEKCVSAQLLLVAFAPERSVPLSSNIHQVRLDSESMLWSLGAWLVRPCRALGTVPAIAFWNVVSDQAFAEGPSLLWGAIGEFVAGARCDTFDGCASQCVHLWCSDACAI